MRIWANTRLSNPCFDEDLGLPIYKLNPDRSYNYYRVVRKSKPTVSTKPGGLLELNAEGLPNQTTRKRLAEAWAEFIAKVPEAKTLNNDTTDNDRANDNHRLVWRYLVDEDGTSHSVDEAYALYKSHYPNNAMSRSLFGTYAETVPHKTMNWVYVMDHKYQDQDTQTFNSWATDTDDTPSVFAQNLSVHINKLSPAEKKAVTAFLEGEDVTVAKHPSYKSFQRAKKKLADLLLVDGYEYLGNNKLSSSIEGNGGRAFPVQLGSRFKLPKA